MNPPFLLLILLIHIFPTFALPPGALPFASTKPHPHPFQAHPPPLDTSPNANSKANHTDILDCFNDDVLAPLLIDCTTAISLIPSRTLTVDPAHARSNHPLDLIIPTSYRQRKFFLPAAFLSNTCLITIDASSPSTTASPSPPENAASDMFFEVWPNVRKQARRVVDECLNSTAQFPAGTVVTRSELSGGFWFEYFVTIIMTPRGFPGDGWRAKLERGVVERRGVVYNVYEVGGTASGRGTRGVWVGSS